MIEAPEKMFSAEELPPVDPKYPIDEIHQAVLNLHSIAKNLRAQRFSGGALRLDQVSPPSFNLFDLLCYVCYVFILFFFYYSIFTLSLDLSLYSMFPLFQLKLSFTLDKETMMPQGCYVYQYRDSNKLV